MDNMVNEKQTEEKTKLSDESKSSVSEDRVKEEQQPQEEKEKLQEAKSVKEKIAVETVKGRDVNKDQIADEQTKFKNTEGEIALELETEQSSFSNKKLIILVLSSVVIGSLIGGVLFFLKIKGNQSTKPVSSSPTPSLITTSQQEKSASTSAKESTASAEIVKNQGEEPKEKIDFGLYSLQVLNGSGVSGEAGKVRNILSTLEFKNIEVGNADSYDYVNTEVRLKQTIPQGVFEAISELLADEYKLVKGDNLEDSSEYDIVVIVGQKK